MGSADEVNIQATELNRTMKVCTWALDGMQLPHQLCAQEAGITHSTCGAACTAHDGARDVLIPLFAYYILRCGKFVTRVLPGCCCVWPWLAHQQTAFVLHDQCLTACYLDSVACSASALYVCMCLLR